MERGAGSQGRGGKDGQTMYVILFCWIFYTLRAPWYVWLALVIILALEHGIFRVRLRRGTVVTKTADVYENEDGTFTGEYGDEVENFPDRESAVYWAMMKTSKRDEEEEE